MTKFSDTQCILLSTASQRDDGSIFPLPSTIKPGGGITKAVDALVARGFAEERETSSAKATCRTDGDTRYGVFVTGAGTAAIGVGETAIEVAASVIDVPAPAANARSKTSIIIDLLGRADGATLPELIEVTSWLPHTTRAALTGLRKKGHVIERSKRGDVTCYRIVGAG